MAKFMILFIAMLSVVCANPVAYGGSGGGRYPGGYGGYGGYGGHGGYGGYGGGFGSAHQNDHKTGYGGYGGHSGLGGPHGAYGGGYGGTGGYGSSLSNYGFGKPPEWLSSYGVPHIIPGSKHAHGHRY